MSNEYYNASGSPGTGTSGSSQVIRSEFDAIEAMADKLPTLSGNGSKLLAVNSGATSLEAVTAATARVAIGLSSSAFGSGVATALTVNTGTAGSFVVNGGALGTPSSGNGSNITNVNAATLGGATFAAPGSIGSGTPGSGAFTTGSFSGVVTGASFTPTATATNGLGLAGANNPAIYASTTKVIDATTSGANVTGALGVSGNATLSGVASVGSSVAANNYILRVVSATGDRLRIVSRAAGDGVLMDVTDAGETTTARSITLGGSDGSVSVPGTLGVSGAVTLSNYGGGGGLVSVGAADSGGAGYKVLRVPN